MDANGLLTVFTILIAAYALMTEERRADFVLRFAWWDWVILILPTVGILLIIYSDVILRVTSIAPVRWYFGFTKETAIFTLLIILLCCFCMKFIGKRIPKCNHGKLSELMVALLKEKKFPMLAYLINRHHVSLLAAIENERWYDVIRRGVRHPVNFSIDLEPAPKKVVEKISEIFSRAIIKFTPESNKSKESLEASIKLCFKSKAFLRYLAGTHALVVAKFISTGLLLRSVDVSNNFFNYLISTPGSALFRELRDNQNSSYTGEVYIDESNELLQYYFSDVKVAVTNQIWEPIASYVISHIKSQQDKSSFYNAPNDNFSTSDQRWECPIFCGVFFFHIMVSAAIFQRGSDHMSLTYYVAFLKEILNSTARHDSVNLDSEFPTKFDYLIFEIFSNTCSWVSSSVNVTKMAEGLISPEWWAAKSLGEQFRNIFDAGEITTTQKIYYFEMLLSTTEQLDLHHRNDLSDLIFDSATCRYEKGPLDHLRVSRLYWIFERVDSKYNNENSSFRSKLFQKFKRIHERG
ncbi:hypothetical protein AAGV37_19800 [Pseudomonas protegens]|uniref:hypothetical protein n=1 Tax=Pseudomonas protegens TaxID=380021 RepID=UPI0031592A48